MSSLLFAILLTTIAVASCGDDFGTSNAKGNFTYNEDRCKWYETKPTRSQRSLDIQCVGSNKFSTRYQGDPHRCNWYRNDAKGYYECLTKALIKANFDRIRPSNIACDKKNCGNVIFTKTEGESRLYKEIKIKEFE